ncbi:hypothetical protein RUM43_013161 [Polyplax serrata]|uniref:Uncharacterized protein n=1 Tax=Polyplax serrata TaxID=468196 RepID=A0AAN8S021_POLSC
MEGEKTWYEKKREREREREESTGSLEITFKLFLSPFHLNLEENKLDNCSSLEFGEGNETPGVNISSPRGHVTSVNASMSGSRVFSLVDGGNSKAGHGKKLTVEKDFSTVLPPAGPPSSNDPMGLSPTIDYSK